MQRESLLASLSALEPDQIFESAKSAKAAGSSALNGTIGIIMNEEGGLLRMSSVEKSLKSLDDNEPIGYPPISGIPEFLDAATSLVFGKEITIPRVATSGGTGALNTLLKLASSAGVKKVLLPTPTWPNHLKVCSTVGIHITETPYLADSLPCIDSIIEEVAALTQPHVLLMQAGCHNPTGLDPSQDQWKALAKSLKGTSHILLLDFPYQGLGKGVQEDAEVIQICMDAGISFLIAWSASKNHGIYGLRTGVAFAVVSDSETEVIQQHLDMISRSTISVAPVTGQYALSITQSKFKKEWLDELAELRLSLDKKREVISKMLPTLSCINTNGLFIKLPLSADQIDSLKSKNIFLNPNGRLNIAGIPAERIEELCKAIAEVL